MMHQSKYAIMAALCIAGCGESEESAEEDTDSVEDALTLGSAPTRWSPGYADAQDWSSEPAYWQTIQFADLNGDRRADICGRGAAGLYCALSNGAAFESLTRWTAAYADAQGWNVHPSYWHTIQFPDINGDRRADACGRGAAGLYCALSNGGAFGSLARWNTSYSDAQGWNVHPSYWQTIRFPDLSGNGKADVCGRGAAGIHCAL